MTYPYDSAYVPPMPTLALYISVPEFDTRIGPVQGMIDTGADGTLIPIRYLKQLSATPVDDAWIKSHWGEWRHVVMKIQLFR